LAIYISHSDVEYNDAGEVCCQRDGVLNNTTSVTRSFSTELDVIIVNECGFGRDMRRSIHGFSEDAIPMQGSVKSQVRKCMHCITVLAVFSLLLSYF
jgi:hypothetical protein